jgi:hypothetical protein
MAGTWDVAIDKRLSRQMARHRQQMAVPVCSIKQTFIEDRSHIERHS